MRKIIFLVFLSCALFAKESLSVLIVGAGPVGLLTALEVHRAGIDVTLIEDRDTYARTQSLYLFQDALDLLEELGIYIPSMKMCKLVSKENVGLLQINALEYALLDKVDQLGISKINGRFLKIRESVADVFTENGILTIPYDILVGADGFHSAVRNSIQAPVIRYESAVVSSTFIEKVSLSNIIEIPKAQNYKGAYVKKMVTPLGVYIVIQKSLHNVDALSDITNPKVIEEVATAFGWLEEAECISKGKVAITGLTPVYLQRSLFFADPSKQTILVGDAAAVSPFIEGMGVNYGFQTAVRAYKFMLRYSKDRLGAFESFSNEMEVLTRDFMEDGSYLITSQPPNN